MRNTDILNRAKQKIINDILANITLGEITIIVIEKAEEKAELELSGMNEGNMREYLGLPKTPPKSVLHMAKKKEGFFIRFKNKIINLFEKKEEPKPEPKPAKQKRKQKSSSKKAVLSRRNQNKK